MKRIFGAMAIVTSIFMSALSANAEILYQNLLDTDTLGSEFTVNQPIKDGVSAGTVQMVDLNRALSIQKPVAEADSGIMMYRDFDPQWTTNVTVELDFSTSASGWTSLQFQNPEGINVFAANFYINGNELGYFTNDSTVENTLYTGLVKDKVYNLRFVFNTSGANGNDKRGVYVYLDEEMLGNGLIELNTYGQNFSRFRAAITDMNTGYLNIYRFFVRNDDQVYAPSAYHWTFVEDVFAHDDNGDIFCKWKEDKWGSSETSLATVMSVGDKPDMALDVYKWTGNSTATDAMAYLKTEQAYTGDTVKLSATLRTQHNGGWRSIQIRDNAGAILAFVKIDANGDNSKSLMSIVDTDRNIVLFDAVKNCFDYKLDFYFDMTQRTYRLFVNGEDMTAESGPIGFYQSWAVNNVSQVLFNVDGVNIGRIIVKEMTIKTVDSVPDKLTIGTPSITDMGDGSFKGTVTVDNGAAANVEGIMVIGHYNSDNKLEAVNILPVSVMPERAEELNISLDAPKYIDGDNVKLFLWDNSLKPLTMVGTVE